MEKEISSGTMLGIVLIALAAVIGLGFGVFSIAKGVANEGTVGVQDNLNTVTDSAFEDYNDKIVTGTQVKSAMENFKGKSVAILINTTAMNKGVTNYVEHKSVYGYTLGDKPYVNYNAVLAKGTDGSASDALGSIVSVTGNKGAPVVDTNKKSVFQAFKAEGDSGSAVDATMKDGYLTVAQAFALDSAGKVFYDYTTGGFSRTGNCEYINASSKFEANLIKDTSGTNIGIMFTQMAK